MAKYDFVKIKSEYETGKYTYKDLSEKYGVDASYLRKKGSKENWVKGRLRDQIEKKSNEKLIESEAEERKRLKEEYIEYFTYLKLKTMKNLRKNDNKKLTCCRTAMHILEKVRKQDWEIRGLTEVAKKLEITNNDVVDLDADEVKENLEQLKKIIKKGKE